MRKDDMCADCGVSLSSDFSIGMTHLGDVAFFCAAFGVHKHFGDVSHCLYHRCCFVRKMYGFRKLLLHLTKRLSVSNSIYGINVLSVIGIRISLDLWPRESLSKVISSWDITCIYYLYIPGV